MVVDAVKNELAIKLNQNTIAMPPMSTKFSLCKHSSTQYSRKGIDTRLDLENIEHIADCTNHLKCYQEELEGRGWEGPPLQYF